MKTIPLRFANVYGPYCDHKSSVASRFVVWARRGEAFRIYGDGNQTRDFVHVDDVCRAIYLSLMALDNPPTPGRCYGKVLQIASRVETRINELTEIMKQVTEGNLQVIHEPEREGEIRRSYFNVSRARAMLGFEPQIKLREGMKGLWQSPYWGDSVSG